MNMEGLPSDGLLNMRSPTSQPVDVTVTPPVHDRNSKSEGCARCVDEHAGLRDEQARQSFSFEEDDLVLWALIRCQGLHQFSMRE